jgi:hypothetical protein
MSKRWKTVGWPSTTERKHPSQAAAYRHVIQAQTMWLDGSGRDNKIVVWVSEDRGPWQRYEALNLNDR